MPSVFYKDPDAVLDYTFDWSDWLTGVETIASYDITAETGITVDSDSNDTDSVTVWLSGGTASVKYTVGCEITTNSVPARTDERSMVFRVVER
jgi:hypothetical protein